MGKGVGEFLTVAISGIGVVTITYIILKGNGGNNAGNAASIVSGKEGLSSDYGTLVNTFSGR
jgi:hypothetical protein